MGLEVGACVTLETYYYTIKTLVEFVIILPEQQIDKLERYVNRIINVKLFQIMDLMTEIKKWLKKIINAIVENASYKKVIRVCNDLFRCQKFIDLIGEMTGQSEESRAKWKKNQDEFRKQVCEQNWTKILLDMLQSYIDLANGFLMSVKIAMDYYLGVFFNALIKAYHWLLDQLTISYKGKKYTIRDILDNVDSLAQCVFGACNIASTATNWTATVRDSLKINKNGKFKKTEFLKDFAPELNKSLNEILSLEKVILEGSALKKFHKTKPFNLKKSLKTYINDPANALIISAKENTWKKVLQTDTILDVQ